MEKLKYFITFGCILLILGDTVQTKCTISNDWNELSMEERLLLSETVVYGRTNEHLAYQGTSRTYEIQAVFHVYCVLKTGKESLKENIFINKISPRTGCSGTTDNMKIGDEAIVGLKKAVDGNYEYDEAMPMQSVSFAATFENLYEVNSICDLQDWSAPAGATVNMCPICGVANFTESVIDTAPDANLAPCIIGGIKFGYGTDCKLFQSTDIDVTSTCIPANYKDTCTRLAYTQPSVICECTVVQPSDGIKGDLQSFGDTNTGLAIIPCITTVIVNLLFSV